MTSLDEVMDAVSSNDLPLLAQLLQKYPGLDLNARSATAMYESDTPLSAAVDQHCSDMVALLLLHGARPMDLSTQPRARITREFILIETMLLHKIDVNKPFGYYLIAGQEMSRDVAEQMLTDPRTALHGNLDFYLRNIVENKTPLIYAIEHRKDYVVEYLLRMRGANPNLGMDRAWTMFNTPLALAASYVEHGPLRNNPNVHNLLAFGADPLHSGTLSQELRQEHWRRSQSEK